MYKDTLERIRREIAVSRMIPTRKAELAKLLDELENQMDHLPESEKKGAATIASLTGASYMVSADEQRKDCLEPQLNTLKKSVHGFEVTHPELVRVINRICMMFSGIGV